MVAFITSPIDTLVQGATRARAPGRTCTAVPTLPCKPNSRCDLRETKLAPNTRWGSRSRDPIGYEGRQLNIYEFVDASPLVSLDPSGKRKVCCKNRFMGIVEMECADGNTARECCSDLVIEAVDAPCERRQNCWKSGSAKVAGCSLIVAAPTDPSDVIGTPVGLCVAGGATLVWLCCANEVLDLPKVALPRIPLPRLPNPTPTPKKKPLGPDWPAPPIENPKKNECPLCICHKANDSVEFYDKFTSKYSCENFPNTEKGKSEECDRHSAC